MAGWRAHRRWRASDSRLGFSPWEHLVDEWTGRQVVARFSRRGSVWSTENGSWGRIGCSGEMGVLLGALYRAGVASRGSRGEESVVAGGV
jgi:hypothetical protein